MNKIGLQIGLNTGVNLNKFISNKSPEVQNEQECPPTDSTRKMVNVQNINQSTKDMIATFQKESTSTDEQAILNTEFMKNKQV